MIPNEHLIADKTRKPAKRPPASRLPAPVDHEVRPMTKPTNTLPPWARTVVDQLEEMRDTDWDGLISRVRTLAKHDAQGTTKPDGHKTRTISGDIPASDPEALTPVEAATDTRAFAGVKAGPPDWKGDPDGSETACKPDTDEVRWIVKDIERYAGATVHGRRRIVDNLNAAEKVQTWTRSIGQASVKCCEPTCQTEAAKGERGRCHSCYEWLRTNKYDDGTWRAEVPEHIIADRQRTRQSA